MAFFHCNPRHHTLAFYAARAPKQLQHFMLQLTSSDDVGATFDLGQGRGMPIARGLGRYTNDHMVSFYLRTPSGFEVEYGWGGRTVDDSLWQVQKSWSNACCRPQQRFGEGFMSTPTSVWTSWSCGRPGAVGPSG